MLVAILRGEGIAFVANIFVSAIYTAINSRMRNFMAGLGHALKCVLFAYFGDVVTIAVEGHGGSLP